MHLAAILKVVRQRSTTDAAPVKLVGLGETERGSGQFFFYPRIKKKSDRTEQVISSREELSETCTARFDIEPSVLVVTPFVAGEWTGVESRSSRGGAATVVGTASAVVFTRQI